MKKQPILSCLSEDLQEESKTGKAHDSSVVRKIKELITYIVNSSVQNEEDRKDVYQDICMRLDEKYKQHYIEIGKVISWCVTIAKRVCVNYHRNLSKRKNAIKDYCLIESSNTLEDTENTFKRLVEREVIAEFKENTSRYINKSLDKEITHHYLTNAPYKKKLSQHHDCSIKTVNKVLSKSKAMMNEELNRRLSRAEGSLFLTFADYEKEQEARAALEETHSKTPK